MGWVEGRVRGRDFGLSEVRGALRAMVCVRRFWPWRDEAADQLAVSPATAEKEARRSEEPVRTLCVRIHKMYRHRDDLTRLDRWFVGGLFFLKSRLIKVVPVSESVSAAVPFNASGDDGWFASAEDRRRKNPPLPPPVSHHRVSGCPCVPAQFVFADVSRSNVERRHISGVKRRGRKQMQTYDGSCWEASRWRSQPLSWRCLSGRCQEDLEGR